MRFIVPLLVLLAASRAGSVTMGYNVDLSQIKDQVRLSNSLSLYQQLTRRLALNAGVVFTGEKNSDLGRFVDGRTGNASLSFTPVKGIEFGINISRTMSSEEKYGKLVRDHLDNTTSGQFRYALSQWLTLNMSLGAHFIEYMDPSGDTTVTGRDEGGVRNVEISMSRDIFPRLSSNVSFGEHRTLGYQKDTGSNSLSIRTGYVFPGCFAGGNLDAQISASRMFTTYKDSNRTQSQDDLSNRMSLVLPVPVDGLSMEISTGWNYSNRYNEYEYPDSAGDQGGLLDRKLFSRDLSSSMRYLVIGDLMLYMRLSRQLARVDQKRTATGVDSLFDVYYVDDEREFAATLEYTPGECRIYFNRVVQLVRRDTYGTWIDMWGMEHTDNFDYDQTLEVLSLGSEVPLGDMITFKNLIQGQRRETIYIMSEQSANSKISSTYSIEPGFEYDAGNYWKLKESVQFSADYTTFLFPEVSTTGADLLFRRVNTSSSFQKVSGDSTLLGVDHIFRFQDQGIYAGSVFERSEEVINNVVKFNLGFHVGVGVGLTPSYAWEYQRRNYLARSFPPSVEFIHHLGLRSSMSLAGGNLGVNITRSFYSDENKKDYWKASVGLNYQF